MKSIKTVNSTVGFVPTMGALQGHLALMQQSLLNENTVVVFFVNQHNLTTQRLSKIPQTFDADVQN
jgi:pantoate--beta-alanine ligase